MSKLTDWFPPEVKPVHVGVYPRNTDRLRDFKGPMYSYWNGDRWGELDRFPDRAERFGQNLSAYQNLPWRGLAEKA